MRRGGLLHVDAVQGPGRMALNMSALGADLLTLSAHKLGGPKGAGALVRAPGIHIAEPPIKGGGQERGARAGTENVAGIAGFGAAADAALASLDADIARMRAMRDTLEKGLKAATPQAVIFGADAERLPNTTLFALAGHQGRNRRDRLRSRWRCGFFGRGLFVGQGAALACSGRDGCPARCCRRARSASASGLRPRKTTSKGS